MKVMAYPSERGGPHVERASLLTWCTGSCFPQFGKYLESQTRPEWMGNYLDYKAGACPRQQLLDRGNPADRDCHSQPACSACRG
jgi:hypothetical protein